MRTHSHHTSILSGVDGATAAVLLESMICDAVCDNCPEAIEWLFIHNRPAIPEIISPEPGSFIYCCRILQLNWRQLRKSLKSAFEIVPMCEPMYNGEYGICNSKTSGSNVEGQPRVYSKVVPIAKKRQQTH